MKMIRPSQRCRKLREWYGIPVIRVKMDSRVESATVRGVKAYASAPTLSENPPRPVRVLWSVLFLTGVIHWKFSESALPIQERFWSLGVFFNVSELPRHLKRH
jgi:hypothetical protein